MLPSRAGWRCFIQTAAQREQSGDHQDELSDGPAQRHAAPLDVSGAKRRGRCRLFPKKFTVAWPPRSAKQEGDGMGEAAPRRRLDGSARMQ